VTAFVEKNAHLAIDSGSDNEEESESGMSLEKSDAGETKDESSIIINGLSSGRKKKRNTIRADKALEEAFNILEDIKLLNVFMLERLIVNIFQCF